MKNYILSAVLLSILVGCSFENQQESNKTQKTPSTYSQSTEIPSGITTPNEVESSIGTLKFIDGAPYPETAELVYENLDRMRGVDVFLKSIPAASIRGLISGSESIGGNNLNKVMIMDKLMDSKPLFLTGNTSTLYAMPNFDLKKYGPTVLEVPPGMLGALNDAWFRYIADVGPFGQDKGKGGKYLVLPPGYEGEIPEGYFIVKSPTYKIWTLLRTSIADGVDVTAKRVKEGLKMYALSQKDNPPKMEWISGSNKAWNTVHTNDYSFYEHVAEVIHYEPIDFISPEIRGLLASIGIEKGKPFAPDARMKRILTDAVAIANATARSIVWYPRTSGSVDNMNGIQVYPGQNSAWQMGWVDKNVFFSGKDGFTMNSDARVMFHYPFTVVTPAMAVTIPGKGSDYAIALVDADKLPFDGSKVYKLNVPANPPAKDFWAATVYDAQTRSQLQTDQKFPTLGSQSDGIKLNEDGSCDLYFAPESPEGYENNWIQTIPGKSWFVVFRMFGPEQEWIDKEWRPSEVELVK
ncbi:DUF1254 domain-containing protein [Carboxylicivirga sp. M1479]|uniref:DUF1254 domain-containing protein n=1 Tax=Carboxylicivirga sp. M1479 TaxID=2594476 RepID=UPI00117816F2|nr:DUF1254 domain-containing protein [Carboxylicivirga sp. M1479]TRX61481.1 DUF1254 domain-containing protein [Carboxylicivirga sp. M1479]